MGIPFQQLTAGQYFKGYSQPAPSGVKCFFYVAAMTQTGGIVRVALEYILRHTPGAHWNTSHMQGPALDETLLKQGVSQYVVAGEGLAFAPAHIAAIQARASASGAALGNSMPTSAPAVPPAPQAGITGMGITPSTTVHNPLKQWLDDKGKKLSEAEAKAQAKAERNKGKSVVYGNAHSPVCLRCGAPNTMITSVGMYWCKNCELE